MNCKYFVFSAAQVWNKTCLMWLYTINILVNIHIKVNYNLQFRYIWYSLFMDVFKYEKYSYW